MAASAHRSSSHSATLVCVAEYLLKHGQPGDVVITLGAGDGYKVGEMVLAALTRGDGR